MALLTYRKPIGDLLYSEDDPHAFNWVTIERASDEAGRRLSLTREELHDLYYALGRTIAKLEAAERRP